MLIFPHSFAAKAQNVNWPVQLSQTLVEELLSQEIRHRVFYLTRAGRVPTKEPQTVLTYDGPTYSFLTVQWCESDMHTIETIL